MTNEEYVRKLMIFAGIKVVEDKVWDRQLNLTIARDRYGDPSSIILAFEGTPPRLEVYTRIGCEIGIVIVGYKIIKPSGEQSERCVKLKKFLIEFINNRFRLDL